MMANRGWVLAATAVLVGAIAAFALWQQGEDEGPGAAQVDRAQRLAKRAIDLAALDPMRAAQLARDSYHAAPGPEAEDALAKVMLANLDVASIEQAHLGEVTALAASEKGVFTTGDDGRLRSWDPEGGGLLGEARLAADTRHLAATDAASILASAGPDGRDLRLWNVRLRDPGQLVAKRLDPPPGPPTTVAMLAFTPDASQLLMLDDDGRLTSWDAASGDRLYVEPLTDLDDRLGAHLRSAPAGSVLAGATTELPSYAGAYRLVVATDDGRVFELSRPRPGDSREVPPTRQILGPGEAPGEIRSLAAGGDDDVVVGTTEGAAILESSDPPARRIVTPSARGVAMSRRFLVVATQHGLGLADLEEIDRFDDARTWAAPPRGRPAALVAASGGLVAAAGDDGSLTILDRERLGSAFPAANGSNSVAFDDEEIIVTDGDGQSVRGLHSVDFRQARLLGESYFERRPRRRFAPAPDWWDRDEDFYVNDIVTGDGLVAAGGQAPDGTAIVLVWDAETGKPETRLPLTASGLDLEDIEVVSQLALLPEKNLLVAYSAAQETMISWSTDDWRQVATIDVDAIGDLSVSRDEERIAVARLSDEDSGADAGHDRSAVVLLDTDELRILDETPVDGALRLAYSPDGESLAVVTSDGKLSLRSPDGRSRQTDPLLLGDYISAFTIAWRPDGRRLAIAAGSDGALLADPRARRSPVALPPDGDAEARDVAFSGDGEVLAVTNVETGESGLWVTETTLWRAGPADWADRRMCQLGARCEADDATEQSGLVAVESDGRASGALGSAVVAYERDDSVLVADADGESAEVGPAMPDGFQAHAPRWSPDGEVLAWLSGGELFAERAGEDHQWRWPCRCWGFAVADDEIVAQTSDGSALLRFALDDSWPERTEIAPRLPADRSELLALAGERAIVAVGPYPMAGQGGPIEFRAVGPSGKHDRLVREPRQMVYGTGRVSRDGGMLAYKTGSADYVSCGEDEDLALLDLDSGTLSRPSLPRDSRPETDIRSISFDDAGDLTATLAEKSCHADDEPTPLMPPGAPGVLRDGRLKPLPVDGPLYDFLPGARADVLMLGDVENTYPLLATLWVRPPDEEPVRVAGRVLSGLPRP